MNSPSRHSSKGFTIVELLIVVVVIAILAAITIVAYNGITANAKESALKADLNTTAKNVGITQAETGSYPSSKPAGLPDSIQYSQTNTGQGFCATASKDGKAFHITQGGTIQSGACSGHTIAGGGSGGGGTEISANSPIQNVTSAQCQALPEFTGSNTSAIRTVTDNRGGTTRTYEIAKLADDNCWMLTNLRLGSTSGSVTLTPADSDVASNFTLPQLNNGSRTVIWSGAGNDYDTPYTYGPVPGDTGSGTTNYGYLYNFAAATAGETQASLTTGNAQHSICPANWGLPTAGGGSGNDFGDLDIAFGGTGNYAGGGEANIAKWQPSGPFRGAFSGLWTDGFFDQGGAGLLWSASAYPYAPDHAFYANFDASFVSPSGVVGGRDYGIGVRCLLN